MGNSIGQISWIIRPVFHLVHWEVYPNGGEFEAFCPPAWGLPNGVGRKIYWWSRQVRQNLGHEKKCNYFYIFIDCILNIKWTRKCIPKLVLLIDRVNSLGPKRTATMWFKLDTTLWLSSIPTFIIAVIFMKRWDNPMVCVLFRNWNAFHFHTWNCHQKNQLKMLFFPFHFKYKMQFTFLFSFSF